MFLCEHAILMFGCHVEGSGELTRPRKVEVKNALLLVVPENTYNQITVKCNYKCSQRLK